MGNPIFSVTAYYYDRFRPRYPAAMLRDLVVETVGERGTSLVDLGCGTGEIAIPLSTSFDRVTAIDVAPQMVELARTKAADTGIDNITFLVGPTEDLDLAERTHDLIVAGSSFHWMDRELLTARISTALTANGVFALTGGGSEVWQMGAEWQAVAVPLLRKWLGEQRRAGSGTYTVTKQHQDYLEPAGFHLETREYRVRHHWSADEIIGYLYSTSFANPELFGEHLVEFEAELRAGLAALSLDDTFPEELSFYLMLARK